MTYMSQDTGRSKAASAVAVVAVETGVVLAIISAFSVMYTPREPDLPMPGVFFPTDPLPPQPADTKKPDTIRETITRTPPIQDPIFSVPAQPLESPMGTSSEAVATGTPPQPPEPKPTPLYTPKNAVPITAPGSWATTNDYPARDLREGNQGRVGFSLSVGSNGKVQSCVVTNSSSFPGLDKATCDLVSRRAMFRAATDESGAVVAGSYSGTIRWIIPEG